MMAARAIRVPYMHDLWIIAILAGMALSAPGDILQPVSLHDSSSPDSATAGGDSVLPVLSVDGRFVLFSSTANNLVYGDGSAFASVRPPKLNVFLRDRSNSTTVLVSANLAGTGGGDADSIPLGISTNGRFVLFESAAGNLVAADTNDTSDVFLRDLASGVTELVSVNLLGGTGNGASTDAVMTPDAAYVAFASLATNLVAGDTNAISDVFVRDRGSGLTALASTGAISVYPNQFPIGAHSPRMTPDGRHVAFFSEVAYNFSRLGEVFVYDRQMDTTVHASTNSAALLQLNPLPNSTVSCSPRISDDGGHVIFVAFTNTSSTLTRAGWLLRHDVQSGLTQVVHTNANIPLSSPAELRNLDLTSDGRFTAFIANTNASGLTGGDATCILRWDAQTSSTILISGDLSNSVPAGSMCDWPVISPDGQQVAFLSNATNLTTNVLSGEFHLYVHDVPSGTTRLVDADPSGQGAGVDFPAIPQMNANGSLVGFASAGTSLVADDRNLSHDVFVRDLTMGTTELISMRHPALPSATPSAPSGVFQFSVSSNGQQVAFSSDAGDLTTDDPNGLRDVFVRDLLTGSNSLVSVGTNGVAGNGLSSEPAISGNGRYLAFSSTASNLVAADKNSARDVFVRNLVSGTTVLASASRNTNLISLKQDSLSPQINEDGRFVLFRSTANYLTPENLGAGIENLFLRDMQNETNYALTTATSGIGVTANSMTPDGQFIAYAGRVASGITTLYVWDTQLATRIYTNSASAPQAVAISSDGQRLACLAGAPVSLYAADVPAGTNWLISAGAFPPSHHGLQFSEDGQLLVYATSSLNSPEDTNTANDVYLHDFTTGTNTLISRSYHSANAGNAASDSPCISPDGRFVAYRSSASDIVPGDNNEVPDLFLFDRVNAATFLISVNQSGDATADNRSLDPAFSADSSTLVFRSWASDLQGSDFNQRGDLFLLRLGAPAITDSDNDEMDDQWELDYFSTLERDGESDFDLDGAKDLFEFKSGTNPTNLVSVFRAEISAFASQGQNPVLTWPSAPCRAYSVQYNDDLNAAGWQNLDGNVTMFGNTGLAVDLSPAAGHRYYRIRLVQ